jgi:hypothetical protein
VASGVRTRASGAATHTDCAGTLTLLAERSGSNESAPREATLQLIVEVRMGPMHARPSRHAHSSAAPTVPSRAAYRKLRVRRRSPAPTPPAPAPGASLRFAPLSLLCVHAHVGARVGRSRCMFMSAAAGCLQWVHAHVRSRLLTDVHADSKLWAGDVRPHATRLRAYVRECVRVSTRV